MTMCATAPVVRRRLPLCCALLAALILLRDGLSISVGRPLLLFTVFCSLLVLNADETWLLSVFLFPLYPGLPGNYLTLLLIGKLLFLVYREPARFRISKKTAVFVLLFILYLWIQNLVLDEISVYSFALGAEIGLLFLLFSNSSRPPLETVVSVYTCSVLISGAAALLVFAGEHSFAEIFSGSIRFGDVYHTDGMHMTLDPNFLGFSCLAGIAAHAELLRKRSCALMPVGVSRTRKNAVSLVLIVLLFLLGAIGLSRTFLLCAGGLVALELAACLQAPHLFSRCLALLLVLFAGGIAAAAIWTPELLYALVRRFSAEDLAGANGRAALIHEWYDAFTSSFETLFFGVGLFRTNVHVTGLQYLFGLGLVGIVPAAAAFAGMLRGIGFRPRLHGCIPAAVIAVMSCAIPAACSLSAIFPLIFDFYVSAECSEHTEQRGEPVLWEDSLV